MELHVFPNFECVKGVLIVTLVTKLCSDGSIPGEATAATVCDQIDCAAAHVPLREYVKKITNPQLIYARL